MLMPYHHTICYPMPDTPITFVTTNHHYKDSNHHYTPN